ncbi:MAG: hypothetical protein Roseis2KO_31880 [Roseivirga sp.]
MAPQKRDYELAFEDHFDSPELNLKNWIPVYLPQWSSTEKSRPGYLIRDSKLVLQITENQQPWCPEFNGDVKCSNLQTGLFSGPVGSTVGQHRFSKELRVREEQTAKHTYLPQYGFFEIRCRVPMLGADNVAALWMIGFEDQPNRSAEICIVELIGEKQPRHGAKVGYGTKPFADPKIKGDFYEDEFDLNLADFHTYGAEWTPEWIDFYIDGKKTRRIYESPDYPMQLMLNLYEVPVRGHSNSSNKYPIEFEIDYVRGYSKKLHTTSALVFR